MEDKIKNIRRKILKDSFKAGACHIGSALSCVEIILALDNITKEKGGVYLFSKASGAETVYAIQGKNWQHLRENPLLYPGGSLGHGLPLACGMAMAGEKVYVVVSDAELQEGTTWESLLFASNRQLSNLTIIVDYNEIQACGKCNDICSLEPLYDKFKAFGCEVREVRGGNNYESIMNALTAEPTYWHKPKVLVCHTTKGRGVDFMENVVEWQYLNLSEKQLTEALNQIK